VLTLTFRGRDAGETGEKVGLFGDGVVLPSNLNQSKLNFSLKGLIGELERESAMTMSPSRSVDRAGLNDDSTRGMLLSLQWRIAVLKVSSCSSLFKSA